MISQSARYFIPDPSTWPITGSIALLCLASGAASWFNGWAPGKYLVLAGLRDPRLHDRRLVPYRRARERDRQVQQAGGRLVPLGHELVHLLRGDVLRARSSARSSTCGCFRCPELGDLEHKLIWPDFNPAWPAAGPGMTEQFSPMGAWGIPAINTLLLLSSGVTVTLAHWALLRNDRPKLIAWMFATIGAGRDLPRLPGLRVRARLQRAQPQAHHAARTGRRSSC